MCSIDVKDLYTKKNDQFHWSRVAVRRLIECVTVHFEEFYDKSVKKRTIWSNIQEEMNDAGYRCCWEDCDKKWRNLKKSYINVLQKQVQGDISSKFPYFDQIHKFLGKEIDPLGLRDQGLNKTVKRIARSDQSSTDNVHDGNSCANDELMWPENAVNHFLKQLMEHREKFENGSDLDTVWEHISISMGEYLTNASAELCQYKWRSLRESFLQYQQEGEALGQLPYWPFFTQVRQIINTFNVITKGKLETPKSKSNATNVKRLHREGLPEQQPMKSKRFSSNSQATMSQVGSMLDGARRALRVESHVSRVEARLEEVGLRKTELKQSNDSLTLILVKLREINQALAAQNTKSDTANINVMNGNHSASVIAVSNTNFITANANQNIVTVNNSNLLSTNNCDNHVLSDNSALITGSCGILTADGADLISPNTRLISNSNNLISNGAFLANDDNHLLSSDGNSLISNTNLLPNSNDLIPTNSSLLANGANIINSSGHLICSSANILSSSDALIGNNSSILSSNDNLLSSGGALISNSSSLLENSVSVAGIDENYSRTRFTTKVLPMQLQTQPKVKDEATTDIILLQDATHLQ